MSPTSALYLFVLAVSAAVIVQLPTRLSELVQAVAEALFFLALLVIASCMTLPFWSRPPPVLLTVTGYFAFWMVSSLAVVIDLVRNVGPPALLDSLLRDEGLRSRLQTECIKLQSRFKKQQSTIAALSHDIAEVCKEHRRRCREFPTVFQFWPRRQPEISAAKYQDVEWTEPHFIFKMCK
jgi:hypothetical protein